MIYYLRFAYLIGWIIIFPLILFFFFADIFLSGLVLSSLSYIISGKYDKYDISISSLLERWYRSLEPKIKED